MTETEIKQMLAQGERLTLECKKAKTELPKSVWESYSAFANTIGGYILLGIDENRKETDVAKRFTIIGVDNIPKLISDLWNTINSNKVNLKSATYRVSWEFTCKTTKILLLYIFLAQQKCRRHKIPLPHKAT